MHTLSHSHTTPQPSCRFLTVWALAPRVSVPSFRSSASAPFSRARIIKSHRIVRSQSQDLTETLKHTNPRTDPYAPAYTHQIPHRAVNTLAVSAALPQLPCRSLCEEARLACEDLFRSLGQTFPAWCVHCVCVCVSVSVYECVCVRV